MNWRIHTLDKAILIARKNGFNDPDFEGWENLDGQDRIAIVAKVLHHGGEAQIIFRKSFARALFGDDANRYLQQMVIDDDRLRYLRDYLNDEAAKRPQKDTGLEL